jgi:N-acetylglucosaminyldiphosphoundecaprenol N-acetyl-beta-D-mannosaminyltransferase
MVIQSPILQPALQKDDLPLITNVRRFPFKVSYLLDIPIACLNYQQVLNYLEQRIAERAKTFCVTLNLDILRLAYENPEFHAVVKSADFIFADGMPVIWLSRLRTRKTGITAPLEERVPGCDIVYDLCRRSHEKGYRIFMLGAAPGVADQAKAKLERQFPNIQVVGTYSPTPQELSIPEWSDGIIETINHSQADILFVALGAPKQENWIHQNRHKLNPYVIIPCGASIDFIAGVQKKSPRWLGKIGLEWLFRLTCNPARLFNRYILNDFPFLLKAYYRTHLLQGYDLL